MALKTSHKVAGSSAAVFTLACTFIMPWEGLWTTAKVDTIGTGQPVTVCYGATKAEIPDLKVGQKFTQAQCAALLTKSLPKYWNQLAPCIHVDLPDSAAAALISASYNAGSGAVCKSPMVTKMNAGDMKGGCEAFRDWFIRARSRVVKGLINRRNGEAELCLSGLNKPKPQPVPESLWVKLVNFLKGLPTWHS